MQKMALIPSVPKAIHPKDEATKKILTQHVPDVLAHIVIDYSKSEIHKLALSNVKTNWRHTDNKLTLPPIFSPSQNQFAQFWPNKPGSNKQNSIFAVSQIENQKVQEKCRQHIYGTINDLIFYDDSHIVVLYQTSASSLFLGLYEVYQDKLCWKIRFIPKEATFSGKVLLYVENYPKYCTFAQNIRNIDHLDFESFYTVERQSGLMAQLWDSKLYLGFDAQLFSDKIFSMFLFLPQGHLLLTRAGGLTLFWNENSQLKTQAFQDIPLGNEDEVPNVGWVTNEGAVLAYTLSDCFIVDFFERSFFTERISKKLLPEDSSYFINSQGIWRISQNASNYCIEQLQIEEAISTPGSE